MADMMVSSQLFCFGSRVLAGCSEGERVTLTYPDGAKAG
jgi:hypothetical protein